VRNGLGTLTNQLTNALQAQGVSNVLVLTNLPRDLGDEQARIDLLSQPLYIVTVQVLGLALLFVLAMAGLLIEGQSNEIATLRSRGAGRAQMLASYALLGLLLAAIAAVAGAWLAGWLAIALIDWLIPTATLAQAHITTAYLGGLATPAAAALPAIGGALLGEGAVVIAAQRAGQLDILAFRREQGRTSHQSVWRRYYLDLQIAVICLLAYLDLSQFGGLGVREALGGATSSPVLLLAPGLLLLAGALILLRLLPYAVALGLRVAARRRGATGMLAFAQVARNPAAPSRLTLLLALAIGLGIFALTFDASLTRNAADRASYQTGADFRLQQQAPEPGVVDQRIRARLAALPGVLGVSAALRFRTFTTFTQGAASVNVLAVDPATWAQTAAATSWRADYASATPAALMAALQAHQWGANDADSVGQTLAGDSGHPIFTIVSQTFASALGLKVGARIPLVLGIGSNTTFVVGAVVSDFPTLYPAQAEDGFIVVNLYDYLGALSATSATSAGTFGPNEYWLKTTNDAGQLAALRQALSAQPPELDLAHVVDRRAAETAIAGNPIAAGMRGQLLLGALIAAALAVLGSIVQSAIAARQRTVQFAVLRTLGMTLRQLTRVLLGEQLIVYLFGLIGGTVLGALLTTTTLPFLQFGDTTIDPTQVGVPPLVLVTNPLTLAGFYGALVLAFVVALLLAATYSGRIGLSQAMRLGED
jgi:putative ABC transport system permease protein